MFKKNKMRGSGILVVVLSAIAFSIYSSTSFLETEHFGVMVSSYIGNIKEKYSKNVSNVEVKVTYMYDGTLCEVVLNSVKGKVL